MATWIVFLILATSTPGAVEVRAVPVATERACRAAERALDNVRLPDGMIVIAATCEGGA